MPTLMTIGECMLELRQAGAGLFEAGYAGDMLNSAFYARRSLPPSWSVEFFSAFGTDRTSHEMRDGIHNLEIGTAFAPTVEDRQCGLYMIHLDGGERSFSYWRSHSAARLLARDRDRLSAALDAADAILFSGITLAILPDGGDVLIEEIARARSRGRLVAFDPNIRPSLWAGTDRMRSELERGARIATVVLPSFADETLHFGDAGISSTIERYRDYGAEVIAVKNGAAGATVFWDGHHVDVPALAVPQVVDTTGAGDSFNGAFLARLVLGDDPATAAGYAARAAADVVQRHGAIVASFEDRPVRHG